MEAYKRAEKKGNTMKKTIKEHIYQITISVLTATTVFLIGNYVIDRMQAKEAIVKQPAPPKPIVVAVKPVKPKMNHLQREFQRNNEEAQRREREETKREREDRRR